MAASLPKGTRMANHQQLKTTMKITTDYNTHLGFLFPSSPAFGQNQRTRSEGAGVIQSRQSIAGRSAQPNGVRAPPPDTAAVSACGSLSIPPAATTGAAAHNQTACVPPPVAANAAAFLQRAAASRPALPAGNRRPRPVPKALRAVPREFQQPANTTVL